MSKIIVPKDMNKSLIYNTVKMDHHKQEKCLELTPVLIATVEDEDASPAGSARVPIRKCLFFYVKIF